MEREKSPSVKESAFVKNALRFVGIMVVAGIAIGTINYALAMA